MKWIRPIETLPTSSGHLIGGKGNSLRKLSDEGLRIPRTLCVTTRAYNGFIDGAGLKEKINLKLNRKVFSRMPWEEVWDASQRIRPFGQVCNLVMTPDDPYAFMTLLKSQGLISIRRSRALAQLAANVRFRPRLAQALADNDLDALRLMVGTHFHGRRVRRVLEQLPPSIAIKSTLKTRRTNLFRPFNVAPVDAPFKRFSDYTCGCRIIETCGLGLTPNGYYMCAVAGGIDRIFGYQRGRPNLPDPYDAFVDQMAAFCPLCGHFGFQWPTRKIRQSKTWRQAYAAAAPQEKQHKGDHACRQPICAYCIYSDNARK